MKKLPNKMIRPDDKEIFSINSDGKTYSTQFMKDKFPNSLINQYTYNQLKSLGFIEED